MTCNNCQKQNASAAIFCNFCGAALSLDHSKTNQEETSEGNLGQTDTGWQIEKEHNLDSSGAMNKQKTISENIVNQNSNNGTKSKKKAPAIQVKLLTIGYILITLAGLYFILYVSNYGGPKIETWIALGIFGTPWMILSYFFWKWKKKREGERSIIDRQSELVGEVRGFTKRSENQLANQGAEEIWNFRLERYIDGSQLSPIPVEMRGQKFDGFITEGDSIMLLTDWKGGLYKTNEVYSLTNGISVKSKQQGLLTRYPWIWGFVMVIVIMVLFGIAMSNA